MNVLLLHAGRSTALRGRSSPCATKPASRPRPRACTVAAPGSTAGRPNPAARVTSFRCRRGVVGGYCALSIARRAPEECSEWCLPFQADADSFDRRRRRDEDHRARTTTRRPRAAGRPRGPAFAQEALRDRLDATGAVSSFGGPLLVCVGDRDDIVSVEEARALSASALRGSLEVFEDAGHILAADRRSDSTPCCWSSSSSGGRTLAELRRRLGEDGLVVLDVRTPQEFAGAAGSPCDARQGHLAGRRNARAPAVAGLPLRRGVRVLVGAPEGSEVIAYCHSGSRSAWPYRCSRRRLRRAELRRARGTSGRATTRFRPSLGARGGLEERRQSRRPQPFQRSMRAPCRVATPRRSGSSSGSSTVQRSSMCASPRRGTGCPTRSPSAVRLRAASLRASSCARRESRRCSGATGTPRFGAAARRAPGRCAPRRELDLEPADLGCARRADPRAGRSGEQLGAEADAEERDVSASASVRNASSARASRTARPGRDASSRRTPSPRRSSPPVRRAPGGRPSARARPRPPRRPPRTRRPGRSGLRDGEHAHVDTLTKSAHSVPGARCYRRVKRGSARAAAVRAPSRRDPGLVEEPAEDHRAPRREVVAVVVEQGVDLVRLRRRGRRLGDPLGQLLVGVHPVEPVATLPARMFQVFALRPWKRTNETGGSRRRRAARRSWRESAGRRPRRRPARSARGTRACRSARPDPSTSGGGTRRAARAARVARAPARARPSPPPT